MQWFHKPIVQSIISAMNIVQFTWSICPDIQSNISFDIQSNPVLSNMTLILY